MHTTNNVPQSRCRAFLIYGEPSKMGRWSKRRWRHAEGLDFSFFSPHKQEKPVSVCHGAHKHTTQRHQRTHHPHHLWAHFPSACIQPHTLCDEHFPSPPSLLIPNKTQIDTASSHTYFHTIFLFIYFPPPHYHQAPSRYTQTVWKSFGVLLDPVQKEPSNELLLVLCRI